jgi:hypothetical protein
MLPIALIIALSPLFKRDADGKRRLPLFNILVALIALALLLPIFFQLADEIYRCDILGIPNCD